MSQSNEELLGYLRELVEKTKALQIPWQKVNPTTYSALVQSANARMTIQRVVRPPGTTLVTKTIAGLPRQVRVTSGVPSQPTFVLQVIEAASGVSVITLNAAETNDDLHPVLTSLFGAIEGIGEKKGLDIPKKIVSS